MSPSLPVAVRQSAERRFARLFLVACVALAAFPTLFCWLATPPGFRYGGFQTNVDDHMVYAAWTWQAAHGAALFDNRFAVDPQPGLTFHLYFLLLGQFARALGVVGASILGRLAFTGLFVHLLWRLVRRVRPSFYGTKLAMSAVVVAGGVGFLPNFWHRFGAEGPIDVWQPEGFVVPSMLTNGLFMVSLCLILTTFLCVLRARGPGWKAVALGAASLGTLMNVHSYDALLVALVMVGFLATMFVSGQATKGWIGRGVLIGLGVVPAALWFVHVLHEDPVFALRAATPTYSPNFLPVLLGYLPTMVFAFVGLYRAAQADPRHRARRLAGLGLAVGTVLSLAALARGHTGEYFLSPAGWGLAFLAMVAAAGLSAGKRPAVNLLIAWAFVGTVAIYFPALFERKLTMGLSIPWALLAALGLEGLLVRKERQARDLVTTLALLVLAGSAVRWTARELEYAARNVSSTTRHPVYLSPDISKIVAYLDRQPGRRVAIAWPGAATPAADAQGNAVPDEYRTPVLPDVAPFLSGLAGVATYDGHWSETPDYGDRCRDAYRFLLSAPLGRLAPMSPEERVEFVKRWGLDYAVLPVPETFRELPLVRARDLGAVVVSGTQFELVRLRR